MRRLIGCSAVLLVAWLMLWGLMSLAALPVVGTVTTRLGAAVGAERFTVEAIEYGRIRVAPTLRRASIDNVSATFELSPTADIRLHSDFAARRWVARLSTLLPPVLDLEVEDFEITFDTSDSPDKLPFERLTDGFMSIRHLPLLHPGQAVEEMLQGIESLFFEIDTPGSFEFSGNVVVRLRDSIHPGRLYTERHGDRFRLRFSRPDLEAIVDSARIDLSPEQIEICSLYPMRVPLLIEITQQARSLSSETFPEDRWRRDALRHVAWSYLLTRAFGAEFAQEVTDAQEAKPGNTPRERAMDIHNNAVGRRLAADGTRLAELSEIVDVGSRVVRHPDQVEAGLGSVD